MYPLQVVVAPILLGSFMQSTFPSLVKLIIPFAPLFAVLASSLLASRFIFDTICFSLIIQILDPRACVVCSGLQFVQMGATIQ